MEELAAIFGGVGPLVTVAGGGISAVAIAYAGILWMTSSGVPHQSVKVRVALLLAAGGLIIVGAAFAVPKVVRDGVVTPVGGGVPSAVLPGAGADCDSVLRAQFVFQRHASSARSFQALVSQVPSRSGDHCSVDDWSPLSVDAADSVPPLDGGGVDSGHALRIGRTDTIPSSAPLGCHAHSAIGGQGAPAALHRSTSDDQVRLRSGRDRANDIIVHWSDVPAERASDDARCWLYVARLHTWSVEY